MITVVIPNWNGARLLPACLAALERQVKQADQVIVVDNGSVDESVELLERDYPWAEVIALEENHGFAGGVNRGIQAALDAGSEFIALLNTDAEPEPEWLEALSNRLERENSLAAAAAKQVDHNGLIDTTGEEYSIWGTPFSRGRGKESRGQYDEQGEVFAATGGASLYRASTFESIGMFDERFFAYYEDVDWSFRARLAGWGIAYEPKAIVRHQVGGTSSQLGDFRLYHQYKNFWFLYLKNMPGIYFWRYSWRMLGVFSVKLLKLLLEFKVRVYLRVFGNVLWHTPGVLRSRRRIQRKRRVTPADINSQLYHAPPPGHSLLNKSTPKPPFN